MFNAISVNRKKLQTKMKLGGCNFQFWYLAAPAYSGVMSMLELTWCVQILYTTQSSSDRSHWYPWNFVDHLKDSEAILRFVMMSFGLHIFWLIASLVLIFQMENPKKWTTKFWMCITFLVTVWSIVTSVYFMVRLNDLYNIPLSHKKLTYNSYLALLLIFSGGFLFWFMNVGLLIFLGRKWMDNCIFCPKKSDTRGFYNPLSNKTYSPRDFNDNNSEIQMDDVIFDAREFRVNKIFHINDEKMSRVN